MRRDIVPGATFPDYELPDQDRVVRRLSAIQGDDPLVLTLARGHYCPKEHRQHLQLAAFQPQVGVAYTRLATISTDTHHASLAFRASVGAHWPFLEDPGRVVQRDLEIQEYTDPENDPMIPHTLVLKPGLVVHSVYNGYWFWGRPSVEDLRGDLRAVTREIRPDWDLSAPELREAWDSGDLGPFHGWNRRGLGDAAPVVGARSQVRPTARATREHTGATACWKRDGPSQRHPRGFTDEQHRHDDRACDRAARLRRLGHASRGRRRSGLGR